ncbi:hypothetical protein RF11_14502 [Thelohanellus kitauei]|uniref:Uncharacterized protein n=1 Tax=Thelohanellus kitauei TaxID=669202 RepID=A0A0C2JYZ0_THEKT|nr:hypothetical protein RF11_14502 [Thelohanellus kitauei]
MEQTDNIKTLPAKDVQNMLADNTITEKGSHSCESQVASYSITHPEIPVDDYINTFLADKSSQINLGSSDIYRRLLISLGEKYVNTPYTIPSKNCVDSIIRNNRGLVERNHIEAVMSPPLILKVNGQPFFRRYWVGDIDGQTHRIIIWVTNESLALMRYNTHIFIDGTFKVTLNPSLPMCDSDDKRLRDRIIRPIELFHQLCMIMKKKWIPKLMRTDSEKALISGVCQQFPIRKF